MINAKKEFISAVENKSAVKCVKIIFGDIYDPEDSQSYTNLKVGYTQEEFESFLNELDFEYHNGFGGQLLFGTIWLEDGTWFTRGEYDGSEWWEYHTCPDIPDSLS